MDAPRSVLRDIHRRIFKWMEWCLGLPSAAIELNDDVVELPRPL